MIKNFFKILIIFIFGAIGGIFADQVLWPYFVERPLFYQYGLEQGPVYITERKEIIIQENTALEDAVEKTEKSVIALRTTTEDKKILEGSGLIISSDGLFITLAELVPPDSAFSFFVDGKAVPFQILKRDLKENLALIKIEQINLSTVGFGDTNSIKLGERVFLVGTIFDGKNVQKVIDEGIIRTFNKDLIITNISEKDGLLGSSLFDIEGRFLGLNTVDENGKIITVPVSKIRQFTGL